MQRTTVGSDVYSSLEPTKLARMWHVIGVNDRKEKKTWFQSSFRCGKAEIDGW
jgi:hypothetical protein